MRSIRLTASLLPMLFAAPLAFAQATFWVATNGVDSPANGSEASPWRSITYALDRVPDASLILVKPGIYSGRIRIRGNFPVGVTVRSQLRYQARLRAHEAVLTIYDDNEIQGINIEGFDIAHDGAGAGGLVVQVQDGGADTHRITFRDNILHDSYNNDILKINNGASDITVSGNLFYNQNGSDEHIDINSVDGVLVEDNVFFNDFAASGRPVGNDTSSYVVVKDSNGGSDEYLGARNVTIRRNVFLNWQGSSGSNFVLLGEDGTANHEAFDCLVENNLMLGNSANTMRAAFGVKGSRDSVFRANTVVGNLPSLAFAMRLNREGSNPVVSNIDFHNNLWSDPTGSMEDFSDTPPADSQNIELRRNGYWNGGNALPVDSGEAIRIANDSEAVTGNPQLPDSSTPDTPVWNPALAQFDGGYTTIRAAFVALVEAYAQPANNGSGIGMADPSEMPADDILGRPRDANPDLGAFERLGDVIFADGFEM
ncbi:MAG: hypothetical protein EYC71_14765 [Gammaproteobacteria bacterium]|nr:MAG: hypothetical protein EYC71_14765 [Gammaproteobacteria bacterium]